MNNWHCLLHLMISGVMLELLMFCTNGQLIADEKYSRRRLTDNKEEKLGEKQTRVHQLVSRLVHIESDQLERVELAERMMNKLGLVREDLDTTKLKIQNELLQKLTSKRTVTDESHSIGQQRLLSGEFV